MSSSSPPSVSSPVLVSVITPVLNAATLLGDTMRSVLGQTAVLSGRVELEYVIADGGSTDGTHELADELGGRRVRVQSTPDDGLYDALVRSWGDGAQDARVMAYLNAGDLWDPHALDVVLDVMDETGARWICGMHAVYNQAGQLVHTCLPSRFRPRLVRSGMYGRRLDHVQQESTFWSGELWGHVDTELLRRFRLAGDQYLWSTFADYEELTIVEALLGGYRVHGGQLSEDKAAYAAEVRRATRPPDPVDYALALWESLVWQLPPRFKKALNPQHLLRYDYAVQRWR